MTRSAEIQDRTVLSNRSAAAAAKEPELIDCCGAATQRGGEVLEMCESVLARGHTLLKTNARRAVRLDLKGTSQVASSNRLGGRKKTRKLGERPHTGHPPRPQRFFSHRPAGVDLEDGSSSANGSHIWDGDEGSSCLMRVGEVSTD
jgi:hypothetical protein